MKEGLGGHIKRNAFDYREMIEKERARIRRIKELQDRVVALFGTGFFASLVGVNNLAFWSLRQYIVPVGALASVPVKLPST